MKRSLIKKDKILKEVIQELGDFYSPKQAEEVTNAVLKVLVNAYSRGDIVDFGLGKLFIRLRKNPIKFSPARPYSAVLRGDLSWEIAEPLVDRAVSNKELFEMLSSR